VSFARRTWPLVFNEVLWSTGVSIYFWAYSRLSEASLPALTIAEQISALASVMATGTASAVAVLIGTELGANRLAQAKANAKKLVALVFGIGLVCACICTGLAFVMPHAFTITPQLKALATKLAIILGVFSPLGFVYGFCFCCMRAGGDTRNAMLLDSGYLWMLPVPAAILMGLFLPGKMGLFPAVIVIQILANAKVLWGLYVVKKGRWVRNITND
jgi:Na+-driven multidrug efflux pump